MWEYYISKYVAKYYSAENEAYDQEIPLNMRYFVENWHPGQTILIMD